MYSWMLKLGGCQEEIILKFSAHITILTDMYVCDNFTRLAKLSLFTVKFFKMFKQIFHTSDFKFRIVFLVFWLLYITFITFFEIAISKRRYGMFLKLNSYITLHCTILNFIHFSRTTQLEALLFRKIPFCQDGSLNAILNPQILNTIIANVLTYN